MYSSYAALELFIQAYAVAFWFSLGISVVAAVTKGRFGGAAVLCAFFGPLVGAIYVLATDPDPEPSIANDIGGGVLALVIAGLGFILGGMAIYS